MDITSIIKKFSGRDFFLVYFLCISMSLVQTKIIIYRNSIQKSVILLCPQPSSTSNKWIRVVGPGISRASYI